jgi:hypothetical protein
MKVFCGALIATSMALTACGGGGGGGSTTVPPTVTTYTAASGLAQKGPLIKGSTVTAQELDSSLSPTGKQYSYQTTSNFGMFSPTNTFGSQYIGVSATGYYFDEVQNAVSGGTITLYGYSNLATDTVLNVNLLTTLEYQRIQILIAKSNMSFAAARTQAESEVLAALNIPPGSYGAFDTLDLSGSTDGDHILAAISSIFVYGNSAGALSQLIANFQSDIGANGVITNPKTTAALVAAAEGINLATVATNLTQDYASAGVTFAASDISQWIAQSGDGVIGKFAYQVPDATPSTIFTFPDSVVTQFAGTPVSVTAGTLSVNGTPASGTVSFKSGDVVTLSPGSGAFPNKLLTSYLVSGSTNLARVSFVGGLISIAVTPNAPSTPKGLTQQFKATGTFSDTSTADLTGSVSWTSATPATATINGSSGLANALTAGATLVTATSGSVTGSTTLTVTPAVVESIAITPNPAIAGISTNTQLTATGTYSDGTAAIVTSAVNWSSGTPTVATIGPTTGLTTGVSLGSTTISAAMGSVTGTALLSVVTDTWVSTGSMAAARENHTATVLPNGKVLVAGGISNSPTAPAPVLATAEIYDPVAGNWAATGNLITTRYLHTATLLPNGKVLVAGGVDNADIDLASAEVYDPVHGTWAATGNLTTSREGHTATLLANGKVLVAGGGTATAEIYDPVAGTWTPTGNLTTARSADTATLLPNGTVLLAGGYDSGGNILSSAELYDPVAGTWTLTGSLTTTRAGHTATLLPNGMALVAGGVGPTHGSPYQAPLASAELYNPSTGTWTATGSLTTPFASQTATLLPNGMVLVAGGSYSVPGMILVLAGANLYDPVTGTWALAASLPIARTAHTATLLPDGTVLVTGGKVSDPMYEASAGALIYY